MSDSDKHSVSIPVTAAQLEAIDRFQIEKGLASREAALGFLLDIAFEAVTGRGRRFWDRRIAIGSRRHLHYGRRVLH